MRLPIAMLSAGLAFTGCGSDGNGPGQEATQLAFTVQPGTSTAGQPLSPPVQVSVLDASGDLVTGAGEAVTLSLAPHSGEATLGGNVTEDAVGGVATFADLTVSTAGTNLTLIATATGLTDVTSASFDVVFAHGVATTLEKVAGAGETATVGTAIDPSPTVKVTDGFGDPVANAAVTFSAGSGGGAVEGAEQTTDAAGLATVGQWTLGTTAGTNTLFADSPGLEQVTFSAEATAGAATVMAINLGDGQSASRGTPVAEPPSVLVEDEFGNAVAGVTVTFAVASGGGSVSEPVQTTGDNGAAFVGGWTLGPDLGENTLTATADGLAGSPVTFTATAVDFAGSATIEVRNNYFRSLQNGTGGNAGFLNNYATDTIAVGGTVTWEWVGQNHNVSAALGSTTSGTHDAPHTYQITFDTPGTFTYRCTNHSQLVVDLISGMAGIVVVR
jgi:adhesin/invasin